MLHSYRSLNQVQRSARRCIVAVRYLQTMVPRIALNQEEERLRRLLLDVSEYVGSQREVAKPQLRFAGGWVRDKLLGLESQDIDIAVDNMTGLKFAEYIKEFASSSSKAELYGEDTVKKITKIAARPEQSKHLETATLTIFGLSIDIANLRKEIYDDLTRNPQIEFGTAEEDALRRDATINALFYNLQDEKVEDLTQRGIVDMQQKVIRTPLDPYQTFKDDPLRILRCIRFASRFGYQIEDSAVRAMAVPGIREALRVKITRERIGVEMEKIFKGPRVVQALQYIEDADLYPIVFSNPAWKTTLQVDLTGWRTAYQRVADLIGQGNYPNDQVLQDLRQWLIITQEEHYSTWVMASVLPYSPIVCEQEYKPGRKDPKTLAALVVREGLKADNKVRDTVDAAFSRINEVIDLKGRILNERVPSKVSGTESAKRLVPVSREEVGILFNDWGISWRATILATMASDLMKQRSQGLDKIFNDYHTFMEWIVAEDLLGAHNLKPLVDGRRLVQEVGKAPGPWMKSGLRTLLMWQFRNPGITDPSEGIKEIVCRYGNEASQ